MAKQGAEAAMDAARQTGSSRGYSLYVLGILGLITVLDYYDRSLISILIEPVERGLHLDDAQIGLLTGVAFAFAYGVFGIPLARLADRYGRVRILTAGVFVW
ncbi:MAG: MFS transporter, partial [Proteobacteria bacterium]|nr:MFS transporter [Pseudomonadota bacterium]